MASFHNWPQLKVLSWFFLWPGEGLKGRVGPAITCLIMVAIPCLFAAEIEEVVALYLQGDFFFAMQPLNEAISLLLFYFSTLFFVFCKVEIEETLNLIDVLNESTIAIVGAVAFEEIERRKGFGRKIHKTFLCVFVVLVTPWTLTPLFKNIQDEERHVILHSWLPFDNSYLPGYITNFIFQGGCAYCYCIAHTMFCALYVSICELIFGHLQILRYRFENMKYGLPSTTQELIACIQHQRGIFQIIDLFQKVTTTTLIANCIFTILLICLILVDLTNDNADSQERVFNVIAEGQTVLIFLGMFCWYGNEITFQCAQILHSCYFSDWYNGTIVEKKLLLFTMLRTIKPVYLGGFVRIDSLTFINIVKGAFSYYNVLTAESKLSVK